MFSNQQRLLLTLQVVTALSCVSLASLPRFFPYGEKTFTLHQMTECKGGKVFEIDNVMDYDQCREACMEYNCMAVNVFQLGEFRFLCEILRDVEGMVPATGAACYSVFP